MLQTYRAVFRAPGSAAFAAAAFVMRIPIAIYPIGLVLILSARSGHYGFAGVLSGVYVFANGAGNPALARLSDRFGQRRLLVPASLVHVAATVVLAVCIVAKLPDWTLLAPTAVCGFTYLSVGSLVRARWSYVLAGRPELNTAYSLESTLDEVIFVVGPLVATLVATQVVPVVVLFVSITLVLGGAVWLAAQRDSEPPPHEVDAARHVSAVRERGMPLLTTFAVAMGMIFASAEVTVVAFCGQHGHRSLSGVVLACFAFGSATAGFVYGSRHWHTDLLTRFRLQATVFALLPVLFLAAVNIGVLAGCAVVVGAGIAPTLITAFALIERIVPSPSLTEGLAWLVTGLSVGYGLGAAMVGSIADAHGARTAFLVTIGAGLLMGALGFVLHARLSASDDRGRTSVGPSQHAALP
ncbi:MAG: MFS transporter [Jatrophihabitantaceae bacterium]